MTEEVKKMALLANMTEKTVKYKLTLSYSISVLLFQITIAAGILLLLAFDVVSNLVLFAGGIVFFVIIALVAYMAAFWQFFAQLESPHGNKEGLYWTISFIIPFAALYLIFTVIPIFPLEYIWFPALGLSYLMVAILIEHSYVTHDMLLARPYLIQGILLVILSGVSWILYTTGILKGLNLNIAQMGAVMLTSAFASVVSIIEAEKSFNVG